jgi:hypothetical protein
MIQTRPCSLEKHTNILEGDLKVLFYIEGDRVVTLVLGTHDVYR